MLKKLFLIILFVSSVNVGYAQLVAWRFESNTKGSERTSRSTTTQEGVEVSVLSRGAGVAPQQATNSFASVWAPSNSMLGAVRQSAYYQFTVTPSKGNTLSLDSIEVVLRVQANAAETYIVTYSLDGALFVEAMAPRQVKPTINDGEMQPIIKLSDIAEMRNIAAPKSITFRLYAWGGTEEKAFRIGKSSPERYALALYGEVIKIEK